MECFNRRKNEANKMIEFSRGRMDGYASGGTYNGALPPLDAIVKALRTERGVFFESEDG